MRNEMESIETIRKAIRYTTGENGLVAMFSAVVSASVKGIGVISGEIIKVHLVIQYDCAEVGIFWEDYGYKNYKSMGLFGLMSSKWQDFIDMGTNEFKVVTDNDNYQIVVNYDGASSSFMS